MLNILKDAEKTWREIAQLATPLDSKKPVLINKNPLTKADFEAYTDNKRIYVNLNNEAKFKKDFEDIVIPAYKTAASKLYNIPKKFSDKELLKNLAFDTFLFAYFHEQLHPWKCPNSKQDEVKISNAIYSGIKEADSTITKAQAMMKVNNSKNLIWDCVDNTYFLELTSNSSESLEQKICFVFQKDGREIEYQPIIKYPSGILPILYLISAENRTTDVPISLLGMFYSTLSFNSEEVRKNAINSFLADLKEKRLENNESLKILKDIYEGFVSEINDKELKEFNINKAVYLKKISSVDNFDDKNYGINQKYFIKTLQKIFDTHLRYDSLKGFVKVIAPYLSTTEKQGSPDQNTSGGNSGGQAGQDGQNGESEEDPKDGEGKSQEEMDGDSISDTLDDLLEGLPGKEKDDLLEEVANGGAGMGRGTGKFTRRIMNLAADEYYKKNADTIQLKNPRDENSSFTIGNKQVWKLINSKTITSIEASKLNFDKILQFQKVTGLPILMNIGNEMYKLNEYRLDETPLKSYRKESCGIEIPDNWIIIQDSSRSMTGKNFVGTGNSFDLLNRVKYGLLNGLYQTSKKLRKDMLFGVVDFSNVTEYKGLDSLIKIYESKTHPVTEVSLSPQCGGTSFNSAVFKKIEKDIKPGKTICTFITDGAIDEEDKVYSSIQKFASNKDSSLVFVEINSSSSLGMMLKEYSKKRENVQYFKVNDIKSIKDKLSSILIKYT